MLTQHPDANVVMAPYDAAILLGMGAAVQQANAQGRKLILLGGEGLPPNIKLIKSGPADRRLRAPKHVGGLGLDRRSEPRVRRSAAGGPGNRPSDVRPDPQPARPPRTAMRATWLSLRGQLQADLGRRLAAVRLPPGTAPSAAQPGPGRRAATCARCRRRSRGRGRSQDVSFEIARGTIHALMGGNGSGKVDPDQDPRGRRSAAIPGAAWQFGEHESAATASPRLWSAAAGLRFVHQDLGLFETPQRRREPVRRADALRAAMGASTGGACGARPRRSRPARDRCPRRRAAFGPLRPAERTLVAIARALPEPEDVGHRCSCSTSRPRGLRRPKSTSCSMRCGATRLRARRSSSCRIDSRRYSSSPGASRCCATVPHVHTRPSPHLDNAALVELMIGRRDRARSHRGRRGGSPKRSLRVGPARQRAVETHRPYGFARRDSGSRRARRLRSQRALGGDLRRSQLQRRERSRSTVGRRWHRRLMRAAIRQRRLVRARGPAGDGIFINLGMPENISASDPAATGAS